MSPLPDSWISQGWSAGSLYDMWSYVPRTSLYDNGRYAFTDAGHWATFASLFNNDPFMMNWASQPDMQRVLRLDLVDGTTLRNRSHVAGLIRVALGMLTKACAGCSKRVDDLIEQALGPFDRDQAGSVQTIVEGMALAVAPEAGAIDALEGAAGGELTVNCFPKGTKVETPFGERNIEDIGFGDEVLSYDLTKQQIVTRIVTGLVRGATEHWYELRVGGETIEVTGRHPFWVMNERRWVYAHDLEVGMQLRRLDGSVADIEAIGVEPLATPQGTYNLEIEGEHDYFAGRDGLTVLVHNTDPYSIYFSRDSGADSGHRHVRPRTVGGRSTRGCRRASADDGRAARGTRAERVVGQRRDGGGEQPHLMGGAAGRSERFRRGP